MSGQYYGNGQESIGLEMPEIMLAIQIKRELPAALELQAQYWDEVDKMVALSLEVPYRKTVLQVPPRGCIYPGTRPGVLGQSWKNFPSIATMVDKATPTGESSRFDQSTTVFAPQLYVEAVVCSDDFEEHDLNARVEQEGLANRRAKRTLEALVHCVSVDPSLGATVLPLRDPTVAQTDPFIIGGEEAGEQTLRRVFSLVRAQYSLVSYATRFDASQPAPSVLAASVLGG